jgi:hypothetical protein
MYTMNIQNPSCGQKELIFCSFFFPSDFKIPLSSKTLRDPPFLLHQSIMVRKEKLELSLYNRQSAFLILWSKLEDGRLPHGSLRDAAIFFNVDISTISRLWRSIKNKIDEAVNNQDGEQVEVEDLLTDIKFFESGRKQTGRNMKWDVTEMKEAVRNLRLSERQNFRMLAQNIAVPCPTLHRLFKRGCFRRHTSSLKPSLTEENKVARVAYCLEEVDGATLVGGGPIHYKDMMDRVDIDEKWFYQTTDGKNYILTAAEFDDSDNEEGGGGDEEPTPHRTIRHRGHIPKVMFLCAQARPRWDPHRNAMWDGKLGLWPIGNWVPAQRTSTRRPAGTMVWKDETVTKDVYRRLLLEKVFPAIKQEWPRGEWQRPEIIIRVQQDGAPSHIDPADELLLQGLQELEIENKVLLYTQPANSPDCNINDLGFFRALQAQYQKSTPSNVGEIIANVQQAYQQYDYRKINRIWLSLQCCYNKIIDHLGNNDYKLPHMQKERLEREGNLPVTIAVCDSGVALLT